MAIKPALAVCLLFLLLYGCNLKKEPEEDNRDRFYRTMFALEDSLGKKHDIRLINFDAECINSVENLDSLAIRIVHELGGFTIDSVQHSTAPDDNLYHSTLFLQGNAFTFSTSALDDYVDVDGLMPVLDSLTRKLAPLYEFRMANPLYDQTVNMLYATAAGFVKAVDEGFPCSLKDSYEAWKSWEVWPSCAYTDVRLKEMPLFPGLQAKYGQALHDLYSRGYRVPSLTKNRIYITDMFSEDMVDIFIDGRDISGPNKIKGNKVRCFGDNWGIALAYTLAKYYGGTPVVYNKDTRQHLKYKPEAYLQTVEQVLGKR